MSADNSSVPQGSQTSVAQTMPALVASSTALVEQTIDEVFDREPEEALPLVEQLLDQLTSHASGTVVDAGYRTVLETLWNFFNAIRVMRTEANAAESFNGFQAAVSGFDQLGRVELRDLSVGMGTYVSAIAELQKYNIGEAVSRFAKGKDYLKNAGKFGSKFETFIDFSEPDILFTSAVQALLVLDYATAKTLIDRATQASVLVANKYFAPSEPNYDFFLGMSLFYQAYYKCMRALNEFNQFEYDRLARDESLAREASDALPQLARGDVTNIIVQRLNYQAIGYKALLESIHELAAIMQKVFNSTFKTDLTALTKLRTKVQNANDSFSKVGPDAAPLVRFCTQLTNQINNLERLAKPSKKDFGALSGLVSCALFLPLFLIISWVNANSSVKLEGKAVIAAAMVMALIGGFGFGALKFKSLIFPSLVRSRAEKNDE